LCSCKEAGAEVTSAWKNRGRGLTVRGPRGETDQAESPGDFRFLTQIRRGSQTPVAQAQDCNDNSVPENDDLDGSIYWADKGTNIIQWADLDGPHVEDLATTRLVTPFSTALDAAGNVSVTDFGEKLASAMHCSCQRQWVLVQGDSHRPKQGS